MARDVVKDKPSKPAATPAELYSPQDISAGHKRLMQSRAQSASQAASAVRYFNQATILPTGIVFDQFHR